MWPFETRAQTPVQMAQSNPALFEVLFGAIDGEIVVNRGTMLQVPAVAGAVNFLAGTMAGLPFEVYKKAGGGREAVSGQLSDLLHYAVNDETSSFDWRYRHFADVFTTGRGVTYIEKASNGTVLNLFNLNPEWVTVKRSNGRKEYHYQEPDQSLKVYRADEIIDTPFMIMPDGLNHKGPLAIGKEAIQLALAVGKYATKFLANGGVPPFAVTGNFQTSTALKRAGDDLQTAVKKAAKESRQALTLPAGLEIKPIGSDPDKSQMIETQRWCVEQVARIYGIPPTFLQDLTHGTFSNTEQQDLHFSKHTIKRWCEQFEQECNLKLFGRRANSRYVEFNLDGLLRGDFSTRMTGYATAITHGIVKPSEVRGLENWPDAEGADQLFIQGATVPITQAGGAVNGN